jgi:hypothetical protein
VAEQRSIDSNSTERSGGTIMQRLASLPFFSHMVRAVQAVVSLFQCIVGAFSGKNLSSRASAGPLKNGAAEKQTPLDGVANMYKCLNNRMNDLCDSIDRLQNEKRDIECKIDGIVGIEIIDLGATDEETTKVNAHNKNRMEEMSEDERVKKLVNERSSLEEKIHEISYKMATVKGSTRLLDLLLDGVSDAKERERRLELYKENAANFEKHVATEFKNFLIGKCAVSDFEKIQLFPFKEAEIFHKKLLAEITPAMAEQRSIDSNSTERSGGTIVQQSEL